jgi:hypothetical protein
VNSRFYAFALLDFPFSGPCSRKRGKGTAAIGTREMLLLKGNPQRRPSETTGNVELNKEDSGGLMSSYSCGRSTRTTKAKSIAQVMYIGNDVVD